eukprot:COSAG01_NODE_65235_length_274_cov_0.508571_1_plen_22_part_10
MIGAWLAAAGSKTSHLASLMAN